MQSNVTARTPSPVVVVVTPAGTPGAEARNASTRPASGRDRSPEGMKAPLSPPGMRRTSLRPSSGEDNLSSPLLTVPGLSDSTEQLKQEETETTPRNDNSNLTLFAPNMSAAPSLYKSSTLPVGSPTFQKVLLELQEEAMGHSDNETVAGIDSKRFSKENNTKYASTHYRRRSSVNPSVIHLRRKSLYAK